MLRPSALLICALVLTTATQAVVNSDAQRREAPIADSYGPPPSSPGSNELPSPVYGAPAVAHYPPPPPDIPPPLSSIVPHKEYGVPVQNFGPPKINIEYGPPQISKPVFHGPPKPVYGPPQQSYPHPPHHSHPPHFSHPPPKKQQQPQSSFFESLFSTFGFGGGEQHHGQQHHGQQQFVQQHHSQPQQSHHHYGPPPKPVYGPPGPQHNSFPKPSYGAPSFPQPAPKPLYGPPKPAYGPPKPNYGPPKPIFSAQQSFGHHSSVHVPPTPPEIKCDGWKPIAGPVVQTSSSHVEIHAPESSYGPPPSGDFLGTGHQQGSSDDIGLQLPHVEHGPSFNNDLHSGLELSKGNSFEIHSNFISDSYGAPPADTYAPGKYNPSFLKPLPPPPQPPKFQLPPSPIYGAPYRGGSYPGLAISHGSISGNLKPWSGPIAPPRQPIAYRPPVPQGLIESIGHTVEQLDNFGNKPHYSGDIYLPPPTSDISTGHLALELNTLPSDHPPKPFLTQHQLPEALSQIQQPRHQEQQVVSVASDCGHGPELSSHSSEGQSSYFGTSGSSGSSGSHSHSSDDQSSYFGTSGSQAHNSDSQSSYYESSASQTHSSSEGQSSYFGTSGGSQSFNSDFSNNIDTSYGPPASGTAGEFRSGHQLEGSESVSTVNLPGLDGGLSGLELVSAQKSQSLSIPVQGKHGSYQLQFQAADPVGSGHGGAAPHEQILSEGLLQSILSAIEQPQGNFHQEESSYDPNIDHSEVSVFLKSPAGQKTLSDHSSSSVHKR